MAKKILFIEDEAGLQQAVSRILKGEEYEVLSAMDGEEGLRLAKEQSPDLILLDLILPKKDGFEVLKELKSDPILNSIKVIVLTNLENSEDIEKALALGASTYLVKANYNLEELKEKIKNTLS